MYLSGILIGAAWSASGSLREESDLFDKFRRNSAAHRLLEERLYEQVVIELSRGQKRDGLWAKAFANSGGSEEKARSLYIHYRVQSIKDEFSVAGAVAGHEKSERKKTPVKGQQQRINDAQALLRSKGYSLLSRGSGWKVKESSGRYHSINTLDELEECAKSWQNQ